MDEGQERPGRAAVGGSLDHRGAARMRVHESRSRRERLARQVPDGRVRSQVPDELGLVAEGEAADVGVDAVGADDHVDGLGRAVPEGDVDPAVGLGQALDRVVEDVGHPLAGRGEQHLAQCTTGDLHVTRRGAVEQRAEVEGAEAASAGGEQPNRHVVVVPRDDLLVQSHPADDVDRGAADVHRVAARAQAFGAFDDRDVPAGVGQPVGESGSGDARAGDQGATCGHGGPPRFSYISVAYRRYGSAIRYANVL